MKASFTRSARMAAITEIASFASLGIAPGKDGDYGRNFGLNDKQREQVKAAIEKELGITFPRASRSIPRAT